MDSAVLILLLEGQDRSGRVGSSLTALTVIIEIPSAQVQLILPTRDDFGNKEVEESHRRMEANVKQEQRRKKQDDEKDC